MIPDAPILALTATATPEVVKDIRLKLGFREDSKTFRMSFERKNLAYIVRRTENKQEELLHILIIAVQCAILTVTESIDMSQFDIFLLGDQLYIFLDVVIMIHSHNDRISKSSIFHMVPPT